MSLTDRVAPVFARARQQFAGDTRVIEAAEAGQNVLTMSADEIRSALGAFESAAERDIFRRASVSAIRKKLLDAADSAESPNLVRSIFGFGKSGKREQLAALFDNGLDFARFEAQMRREIEAIRTRNFTLGGSNTADKLIEARDLEDPILTGAEAIARSGPVAAGREFLARNTVGRFRAGVGEGTRAQIAAELFNFDNGARANEFLKALEDLAEARQRAQTRRSVTLISAGAGSTRNRNAP